MSDRYISAAYHQVCKQAEEATPVYVSLYARDEFYGGPEEGGWWGHDYRLLEFQKCSNQAEADALAEEINKVADELSKQAHRSWGENCRSQLEWVEQHDPMDDTGGNAYFGEPDGPTKFVVFVEDRPGEFASQGDRAYS